jgi:hypothetical protein
MLQGQEGTRHLERLSHLCNTITQIFDSIPHNSSTILPSIDSYIATLAFANITELVALNAPQDARLGGPPTRPNILETGQASQDP